MLFEPQDPVDRKPLKLDPKYIEEATEVVLKLEKAIKKQKSLIRKNGYDPSWELFASTLGWFQIRQKLTNQQQELYKDIWEGKFKIPKSLKKNKDI